LSGSSAEKTAAVLISGGGSNLQALIDSTIDSTTGNDSQLRIGVVVSNRADAYGLERARKAGIDAVCVAHQDYAERTQYDAALLQALNPYQADFVFLAGFMRILTPVFIDSFAGRILNIHPSLLPRYPGLHTHQRAIDAGDEWHGCTVHFVSAELDSGPPIIQGRVAVQSDDTADALAQRVLAVEHRIYPQAAMLLASGRLQQHHDKAWLDGRPLEEPIRFDVTPLAE
jgi:phosphoribosylglycinamide formyltransferase-1